MTGLNDFRNDAGPSLPLAIEPLAIETFTALRRFCVNEGLLDGFNWLALVQRSLPVVAERDTDRLNWWFSHGLRDSVCNESVDLWWADGEAERVRVTHGTSVRDTLDRAMRGEYEPDAEQDNETSSARTPCPSSEPETGYVCDLQMGHMGRHVVVFGDDERGPVPPRYWESKCP